MIQLARLAQLVVEQLEQALLGIAPGQPVEQLLAERILLLRGGERLVEGEQVRAVGVLRLARQARVGDDACNRALELLGAAEQRNGVVVALRHLASVKAGQRGDAFLDHRFRQGEELATVTEQMIEALSDIAGHFHMLDLVAANRHLVRVEHQDVRRHQHRVAVEPHGHAGIRVLAVLDVLVHRGLVGMGAVEQPLGGDAGQQPGQLGDFRNVGLTIEGHAFGIEAASQPGRGNLQARALDTQRVIALDQRVVVGQEIKGVGGRVAAGQDGRADRASVVAQVRRAGGGDTGQDAGSHAVILDR